MSGEPNPPADPPVDPPADPPQDPPKDPPVDPPADPPAFNLAPDDWRQNLIKAAGYEGEEADKRLAQLDRMTDLGVLAKSYLNAQDKISKGITTGLPENPTDEEIAAFREANDIPAEVGGYEIVLEDGLQALGEAHKDIIDNVLNQAHAGNVPNDVASNIINSIIKDAHAEQIARDEQDGIDTQNAVVALRDNWGSDYEVNRNMIKNLVGTMPEEAAEQFLEARLPDGKGIFNDPVIMHWIAGLARQLNPVATVVPGDGPGGIQSINDEIEKLEARMTDDDWHRDVEANKRLEALYEARDKYEEMQNKQGAA